MIKPTYSARGLSSQAGGAQELPGGYTSRPFPDYVGKRDSHVCDPSMGTKTGKDAHGKATNRRKTGKY